MSKSRWTSHCPLPYLFMDTSINNLDRAAVTTFILKETIFFNVAGLKLAFNRMKMMEHVHLAGEDEDDIYSGFNDYNATLDTEVSTVPFNIQLLSATV